MAFRHCIAAALACLPMAAAAEVPRLAAEVDLAAEDRGFAAVEAFAAQLPQFPTVIALDLLIKPDTEGQLGVALIGNDTTEALDLDCSQGFGFVPGTYQEVSLPLQSAYPHLLLTVRLNGLDESDGLVMACEYTGDLAGQFRLQGMFVTSMTTIPTAHSVVMSARPLE